MAKQKFILAGITALRPTVVTVGFEYFNTSLNRLEIWNGTSYQPTVVAAVSADTALAPSATYTQAEVQAILTELRDLKTKLRTAGILAT